MLVYAHGARAQSGWSCDPHDFLYDMTVYLSLKKDATPISNLENYEVAAFVGNECRGIAEVLTMDDSEQVLYLRVRSNKSEGESISFKAYDLTEQKVISLSADALTFQSNATQGKPGSPMALTIKSFTPGDVNGDGKINAVDVRLLINRRFNRTMPTGYIEEACDLNGDKKINAVDVRLIINLRFNR